MQSPIGNNHQTLRRKRLSDRPKQHAAQTCRARRVFCFGLRQTCLPLLVSLAFRPQVARSQKCIDSFDFFLYLSPLGQFKTRKRFFGHYPHETSLIPKLVFDERSLWVENLLLNLLYAQRSWLCQSPITRTLHPNLGFDLLVFGVDLSDLLLNRG